MADRNYLINPNVVSHRGAISEDQLRARLLHDAFEQAGWLDDNGKPLKGCDGTVRRNTGRAGGYSLEIRRDLDKSDQPRLAAPKGESNG